VASSPSQRFRRWPLGPTTGDRKSSARRRHHRLVGAHAIRAGEIPISINPLPEVVGQIEGNAVRALAVTTAQRSKALPDVPTVAKTGIVGYDAAVWSGVLGPAGTAPEVFAKIHADLAAALKDPVVLTALEKMGATPVGSSPADFDAFMRAEAKKWEPVLKEADIKMQ
jgi:tripartite-type tricarboxylate transporter receptor subunit TctC